jgi:hypothetical protein
MRNLFSTCYQHFKWSLCFVIAFSAYPALVSAHDSTPKVVYPHNYHATYTAFRRGDEIGTATRRFKRSDTGFCRISMYTRASIFFYSDKRNEFSEFLCPDSVEIKPLKYVYNIERTFKDSHHEQTFDWTHLKERGESNKKKWSSDIKHGYFDRISIYTQLAIDIEAGKDTFRYPVTYEGQTKEYVFEIVSKERLKLPIGSLDTIKIKRIRSSQKRETFIWLSQDHHSMPVRIQQFKDGKEQADLQLKKIDYI